MLGLKRVVLMGVVAHLFCLLTLQGLTAAPAWATPCAKPASITVPVSDRDGRYLVQWGASATSEVSYVLQEATDAGFTTDRRAAYRGTAQSVTIKGRVAGTTYYYRVKAIKDGLAASPWRLGGNGCAVDPPPPAAGSLPLNDTGITWYADANQKFLATPPLGFEGQDADYGRDPLAADGVLVKEGGGTAGFDFTKLDPNGNDLPASAAAWSCVRDNHTGLVWEEKSNDGGLRDQDWTYSWYNSDPSSNGGAAGYLDPTSGSNWCGGTLAHCNTEAYVAAVNEATLCGASDWRLPSSEELHSLVDYGRSGGPSIDTAYFPHARYSLFWSSSPDASSSNYAWYVNFTNGYVGNDHKNYSLDVRLVRGGQ